MSRGGTVWYYLFCANCGVDAGRVLKTDLPSDFAFAQCDECAKDYPIEGIYVEPDYAFTENVIQEQMETYGRMLTPQEQVEVLKDGNSTLAKLARDWPDFTKIKGI
jgi:hypothetical protein